MNERPEALYYADRLEELDASFSRPGMCGEAATELRRQHSRIKELEAQHSYIAILAHMDAKKESAKRIAELEAEKDAWQGRFYAAEGKA